MITLGIDLSSQCDDTVACAIAWSDDGVPRFASPAMKCDDVRLHQLMDQATVTGIDAPFGWPKTFAAAVAEWTATTWTSEEPFRLSMRYRATDLAVHTETDLWPLSVSSDRIALPAMRAMSLLQHRGVRNKVGGAGVYEVYPAGSLKQWKLPYRNYKGTGKVRGPAARKVRQQMLRTLRRRLPGVVIPPEYAETDHAFDALVSALTARAAKLGRTIPQKPALRALAGKEGWIHLPFKETLQQSLHFRSA